MMRASSLSALEQGLAGGRAHEISAPGADVAVIGQGPAGLYCAYRLSRERPNLRLAVFDEAPAPGGRLKSLAVSGTEFPLELGGAFVSSAHRIVLGLVRELGCELAGIGFKRAGVFLRGGWSQSGDELYRLASGEVGKSPSQMVANALAAAAPDLGAECDTSDLRARAALEIKLRALQIDDRPLWQWPFGAFLDRVLSPEAVALSRATYGSTAAFGALNAFDALCTHLWEAAPGQHFYRFKNGFQSFASALAGAMPGVQLASRHRLTELRHDGERFVLSMETPHGARMVIARTVILALPAQAIQQLRFSEGVCPPDFDVELESVAPVPAFKLFLRFSHDWWSGRHCSEDVREIGAVYTDQPLQQCYLERGAGHHLMAVFADGEATEYWRALKPANAGASGKAPPIMIGAAMRQLRRMFAGAPAPEEGLFADWSGAWHAWRPQVRSWNVRARMRQPNRDLPLFICGEAFAERQGWTEGALNNAEAMLERCFGLNRPSWAGCGDPFES